MAIGIYWDLSRLLPTRSLPKSASPSALTFPAIHYIVKLRISRTLLYLTGKSLTECAGTPENLGSERPQKGTVMTFGGEARKDLRWHLGLVTPDPHAQAKEVIRATKASGSRILATHCHSRKAERGRSSVNARQ